jgi:hypothetical protein
VDPRAHRAAICEIEPILPTPHPETFMNDFLVQALPIMVDSWDEILKLLRALAKLFGW